MGFWGDRNYLNGKLEEILDLINKDDGDIVVCMLPLQEKGKYGSPQLMLSEKPSDNCLNKIRESYRIRLFQNDDNADDYKYLMTIETLRFAFEEDWHWTGGRTDEFPLSKEVTGNSWDFDGYFYITDECNSYRRIAVIPFKTNEGFDSGHNLHRNDALRLTKNIVKQLNNGELLKMTGKRFKHSEFQQDDGQYQYYGIEDTEKNFIYNVIGDGMYDVSEELLINSLNELAEENNELKKENKQLKADNNRLVNETAKVVAEHQKRTLDLIDDKIKELKNINNVPIVPRESIEVLKDLKRELL